MNKGEQERVPSRLFEADAFAEYQRKAGVIPSTRLGNAKKARQQVVGEITPMLDAREKVVNEIRTLLAEFYDPRITGDRSMAIEEKLVGPYGLRKRQWRLNEDIAEKQKHLDMVDKRIKSTEAELEAAIRVYVNARTEGRDEAIVYKMKSENRIKKAQDIANARSSDLLREAERVVQDRTSNFGDKLSASVVESRADARRREAKKVLEEEKAEEWEIEEDAKKHQQNYEKWVDDTHKQLIVLGGAESAEKANELVTRKLAHD